MTAPLGATANSNHPLSQHKPVKAAGNLKTAPQVFNVILCKAPAPESALFFGVTNPALRASLLSAVEALAADLYITDLS
jgi:hypothetical protein